MKYYTEGVKRLIHFFPIGSVLPEDLPRHQRWSFDCTKELSVKLICSVNKHCLPFTIVRPINWIGARMDYFPGIDVPLEGVPGVLACFMNNFFRGEPLKLVHGDHSRHSFCCVKDAIEAVLLIIENPDRANGKSFDVGNPGNEVSIEQLADMMIKVYAGVSDKPLSNPLTVHVSSKDFFDSISGLYMTNINEQLGWNPKTNLQDTLEITLGYLHEKYSKSFKQEVSNPPS